MRHIINKLQSYAFFQLIYNISKLWNTVNKFDFVCNSNNGKTAILQHVLKNANQSCRYRQTENAIYFAYDADFLISKHHNYY